MLFYDVCPACDEPVEITLPRDIAKAIECIHCESSFYVDYGPVDELAEHFQDAG